MNNLQATNLKAFGTCEEMAVAWARRWNGKHEEHDHFTPEQVVECVAERIMRHAMKMKYGITIDACETFIIPFFGYVAN